MAFFTRKQKKMAKKCSTQELVHGYERSELNLERASFSGSEKELKNAMKEHSNFEYAMLYKNTPEYKKKCKKNCKN